MLKHFITFCVLLVSFLDFACQTSEKKLLALGAINTKLSAFSSAKAGEVEKTFNGYSPEVIEEHRLLALISKGGHSYKRVENRMKILAYYINEFENKTTPSGIKPI
ncbi:MAG: hypothetical protein ACLS5M_10960 [Ruminococcus sp.]